MKEKRTLNPVPLGQINLSCGFWAKRLKLVQEQVIPFQWKALNDELPDAESSHAIENFRIAAGKKDSDFHGRIFQDSDVAKWLEALSYCLAYDRDSELEEIADEVIDLIAAAQQDDGYLNTYFTVAEPDKRWTNLRDDHELYCAGHMMEAAVAYYEATGKRKLLDVLCSFADHIDTIFGYGEEKRKGYSGHEEIELALIKLYRVTGEERYLALSRFFIDQRGKKPHYFRLEAEARGEEKKEQFGRFDYSYSQAHLPVREQSDAVGHCVRAMYLYSGMADLAMETGDRELKKACERLWTSTTHRRMYITGGIGSQEFGEAFTFDYDLPSDRAYTETCAAIGLVFWAHRMLHLDPDSRYSDVMERALYNGVLSGISLDGQKYFYVNPLEVWPEACENRFDHRHVKTSRQKWFGCACCPPNIARLLASINQYIYSQDENSVYVHLYAAGTGDFELAGGQVEITQKTDYPWEGQVEFDIACSENVEFTLALRIPGWCRSAAITVNGDEVNLDSVLKKGYAHLNRLWQDGDRVEFTVPMPVERVKANPRVRDNAGKVALMRGPIVYCFEEEDNGSELTTLRLPDQSELKAEHDAELLGGVTVITGAGLRLKTDWEEELYGTSRGGKEEVEIKAVPYFAWNNRTPGEMLVWILS